MEHENQSSHTQATVIHGPVGLHAGLALLKVRYGRVTQRHPIQNYAVGASFRSHASDLHLLQQVQRLLRFLAFPQAKMTAL